MKYAKLIKEIRKELSEAALADREKDYVRAKACLLHVRKLLTKALPPRYTRPDLMNLVRAKAIVDTLSEGRT